MKLVFHPHADAHVDTQQHIERFLTDADPALVDLCLRHQARRLLRRRHRRDHPAVPDRITYVRLKQVDHQVRSVSAAKLSLAKAVPLGVMCDPPFGEPDMPNSSRRSPRATTTSVRSSAASTPSTPRPLAIQARTTATPRVRLGPVRRSPLLTSPALCQNAGKVLTCSGDGRAKLSIRSNRSHGSVPLRGLPDTGTVACNHLVEPRGEPCPTTTSGWR